MKEERYRLGMTSLQLSHRINEPEMMLVRRSSPGKFSIHAAVGPNNACFTRNNNVMSN
jgi:hypothetical protein